MTGRSMGVLLCVLLTLLLPGICPAQVVLKPNGRNAIPLRVKAIAANVIIDGQFAATRLTLTFQNETAQRIAADFMYTVPPDTLVTSFAYWYGEERVQAKVVEKEEAAAIYKHITDRMHDPALVEMIGKNTFRARIFPVMPNSDLKVEMTLVQALASDAKGAHFVLPLRMERGESLDQVDVHVHVNPNGDLEKVTDSLGLPVARSGRAYGLTLAAIHFRPQQDLRVNLIRRIQPFYADLFATRGESEWGYFALAVTPDRDISNPHVRIVGIPVKQMLPAQRVALRAHRAAILLGRYRGGGPATILLTGRTDRGTVTLVQYVRFSTQSQPDSVVTKLWAARWMEQLSANGANRNEVMQMSLRYKMPCRYTSWLAVPKEEMERYEREITEAKIPPVVARLGELILAKREDTREGKRLRATLNTLCAVTGDRPEYILQQYYQTRIVALGARLLDEILARREDGVRATRLREEVNDLRVKTGWSLEDAIMTAHAQRLSQLGHDLSKLVMEHREHSARALELKSKLAMVASFNHVAQYSQYVQSNLFGYFPDMELTAKLRSIATDLVEAEHGGNFDGTWLNGTYPLDPSTLRPDPVKARRLRAALHRLAQASGVSADEYLQPVEGLWLDYNIESLRNRLQTERQAQHPDTNIINRLNRDFIRLNTRWKSKSYAEARAELLAVRIEHMQVGMQADAARKQGNTSEAERLDKQDTALQARENELHARMGDPLISVEAPIDAAQVVALMPGGEIKPLAYNHASGKWEARFDIPAYATPGDYTITIIIVLKSGVRTRLQMRYHVDLTPPAGSGIAQLTATGNAVLRLQLDAGEDAARVKALLPWGEVVELLQVGQTHRFFVLAPLSPEHRNMASTVKFIITDRAHNRTAILVDMTVQ